MGTNTGLGIGIGIPFKNFSSGGRQPLLPDLKASLKGVWIAYGKSNNDADRSIVKNLVDPDNPFIVSNAAFKLNSGFGKYEEDFTDWRIYPNIKVTDSVVTTDGNFKSSWLIYKHSSESKINEMNIKVSGIPKGGKILYFYISDETANLPILYTIPKDGIYHLPESKINNNRASVGFTVESSYDWNNIRIEQIPSFEGAFVTDGINDLITSTKTVQEMLGESNEITVVSMIHQVKDSANNVSFTNYIRGSANGYFRNIVNNYDKTGIYGYTSSDLMGLSVVNNILGDKNDYTSNGDSRDSIINGNFSVQGYSYNDGNNTGDFSSVAWYWTIIANKVLTTDEINQVIAYYNLDRCVEPTVLYDVKRQGLSNDTPDSDWYLKDYSGNGYDMTLYNYAKTPESGINEDGGLQSDGVEDYGKVTGLPIYKDYTVVADYERFNIGNIEGIGAPPVLSKSYTAGQGSFIMNFIASTGNSIRSYSFGAENTRNFSDLARQIFYQSKYKSQGFDITAGTGIDGDSLWLDTARDNDSRFFNGAIYSLMTFPYSMSDFLIERQLKKHKLGTLYPNTVEFRPVIKSNVLLDAKPTFVIRGTSTHLNAGDYVPENSQIWVSIKMNNIADRITKFTVNGKTIDIPENAYSEVTLQYGFPFVIDKSPQKISITIEQDENYVLFNPVINSNYDNYKLTFHLREYEKLINIGDYIPKGTYIRANLYLKNDIDELVTFTFNGVNIDYAKNPVLDTAYNIRQIYNYDSPQEVNITIDKYIRYEDIVQPYPLFFEFTDENGNLISWGGKAKVGSTITRTKDVAYANLLEGLFTITNPRLNGVPLASSQHVVEKSMVFTCTATWAFDNNEPKCILSPRLLRIPNSSYKILGYIPDISGHGNHGKINNSAYAEGSGVNEDGSYQFDGVDDFITIPTLSRGGKQMLMKVNWNNINSIIYDQRGSGGFAIYCHDYSSPSDSITIPAYRGRNPTGTTYIDGIRNEYIIASQLRNVTHNIVEILDTSYAAGNINPIIGKSYMNNNYGSLALYDFMLFDNISTDDKIKELNEYVGIEAKVELPPYYWDAYGKTNLDADKTTI